jgi:hypothetical protein
MDFLILGIVVLASISVLGAVASAWFSRRTNVRQLREDVDDIASAVSKLGKVSRSIRMREVRNAASSGEVDTAPPPELVPGTPATGGMKSELRKRFRGMHS